MSESELPNQQRHDQLGLLKDVQYYHSPQTERGVVIADIDETLRADNILQEICPLLNAECGASIDTVAFDYAIDRYHAGVWEAAKECLDICAQGLAGVDVADATSVAEKYLEATKDKIFNFAPNFLKKLQDYGDIYFITAEPEFVSEAFVRVLEKNGVRVTGTHSTIFRTSDGFFSGREGWLPPRKGEISKEITALYRSEMGSVGLGDHVNDINMLQHTQQPIVVVHPGVPSQLGEQARAKGWSIVNAD